MFPILTAAVVPSVQLPPEGIADAPVQQPLDGAFVEAVERAFARGGSRQSARMAAPGDAGGTDEAATSAWAAGLNFQPARFPLMPEQASPNAAGVSEGAIIRNAAESPFPGAAGCPAGEAVAFPNAANRPDSRGAAGNLLNAQLLQAAGEAVPQNAPEHPAFSQASFVGAAHSLRMASLSNPAFPPSVEAANGEAAEAASGRAGAKSPDGLTESAGATGGTVPAGSAMEAPDSVDSGRSTPPVPAATAKATLANTAQAVSAVTADQAVLANVTAWTEVGSAAIPAERPTPAWVLQAGQVVPQSGYGAVNNAVASASTSETGEAEESTVPKRGAGTAPARAARTAAKTQAAPLQEAIAARQASEAGLQAEAVWTANGRTEAASVQQPNARPETVQGMSARADVAAATRTNARPEAVTAQSTSARPEAAMAREISALQERDAAPQTGARPEAIMVGDANALVEKATAHQISARPTGEASAPQERIAAQAATARPDAAAATLTTADMAASASKAGAAPEPAEAVRGTARKGADAARAFSAQPQNSAVQDAGQYARTQAAARQENAYKGQALKPEPDAERDQDAARSRPVGGRQQAAPGAILTVGEGPGAPPAEQATSPAPADGQRTTFDPGPAAQLARAALGAVRRGEARFHLKLRPEGVGEVAVTISAKDNDLHLAIRAGSESTKDLILSQIGGLKQELTQGGYRLEGFSVDVSGEQSGQGGQAFAFRQDPGGQPERRPDARPEPKSGTPTPKEARFPRLPEARAGSINYRI